MSSPARYWHSLDDGRIQCDLCPRGCRLREGQRGFCFVRAREDDELVLTTYGRSSGFCLDPIEKKPLRHFYPGSSALSFGTAGSCRWTKIRRRHEMTTGLRDLVEVGVGGLPDEAVDPVHLPTFCFTREDYLGAVAVLCRAGQSGWAAYCCSRIGMITEVR
ncbi:hypothetical protein [Arsenicicoccus dermatophilus]|uniref:hypothetical protein n=1 Tax=Arsenicicoccus dermatophilus TaxID=1076331 RepID=UPI001F4C8B83|nr:hypothetical protein [Arsenicicoccus dermatophilus]MCH8612459.1 hypothetical protein [Arsenicicoccus dermatophilus]